MNEKFFDLKKEKQDRIINGCMKVFAFCGYAHASTDEMVGRRIFPKVYFSTTLEANPVCTIFSMIMQ